jgi:hypothetical protein
VWGVWGVWGAWRCGRCGGVGSLLTFDIPQTALVATLDTYDFIMYQCYTYNAYVQFLFQAVVFKLDYFLKVTKSSYASIWLFHLYSLNIFIRDMKCVFLKF